jgi:hypothetical protein
MMARGTQNVRVADLLANPENAFWLDAVRRAEDANPASTLNKLRRLSTPPPPITINAHNEILDGRHRVLIAMERGQTYIEANIAP